MREIRFSITKKLNYIIVQTSGCLGVDKADYIKSLILTDLNEKRSYHQQNAGD